MTEATTFRPVIHLLNGCPFSMKALLFLAETGQASDFEIHRVASGSDDEAETKEKLGRHFSKVSFPTVEVAPGEFINESDEIIACYGSDGQASNLPAFEFYSDTVLPLITDLWKENIELKKAAD